MGTNRPTQMWALADAVVNSRACPACFAQRGERCMGLRWVNLRPISQPHPARYPAGNRLINTPLNAALLNQHNEKGTP